MPGLLDSARTMLRWHAAPFTSLPNSTEPCLIPRRSFPILTMVMANPTYSPAAVASSSARAVQERCGGRVARTGLRQHYT
jgi:hypothetical protein